MKNYLFSLALLLFFSSTALQAQRNHRVIITENTPYICHTNEYRYYYIPEINSYYDTYQNVYVFTKHNQWIRHHKLPNYLKRQLNHPHQVVYLKGYFNETPFYKNRVPERVVVYENQDRHNSNLYHTYNNRHPNRRLYR